jgi:predicted component of type VI protein secretion system
MNVRLVVEKGRQRTRVVNLEGPQAILGRARGNTVRIPSAEVSRQHCRLRMEDGLVLIEDLESINGTFLNGEEVVKPEVVRPGDRLDVGPVTFVVEYDLTPAALARLQGDQDFELVAEEDYGAEAMTMDEPLVPPPELNFGPVPAGAAPQPGDAEDDLDPFEFDGEGWDLPEGGKLRDILSQIDENDEGEGLRP